MGEQKYLTEQLKKLGVEICRIKYHKRSKTLKIYLKKLKNILESDASTCIKEGLRLSPDTELEFIWEEKHNMALNKENFVKFLTKEVPSCKSWIENCICEVKDTSVDLSVPNETIFYALQRKNLNEIFRDYTGFDVNITLKNIEKEAKDERSEKFRQKLITEESSISTIIKSKLLETYEEQSSKKENEIINVEKEYIYGKDKFIEPTLLKDSVCPSNVTFELDIFAMDHRDLKSGKTLVILSCSDRTDSRIVKLFLKPEEKEEFYENIKIGTHVLVHGKYDIDKFDQSPVMIARGLKLAAKEFRMDTHKDKRIEFHLHSKMSNTDGTHSIKEYIAKAAKWGHEAIALTDHNVVQAFPDAMSASKKYGIKVLYGVEGDLVDDTQKIFLESENRKFDGSYVVFDIETTGFSPMNDEITEIGAVKIQNGRIVDRFSEFVNPHRPIPEKIVELTGITDDMVKNADSVDVVLSRFEEFVGDSILVAHNALFDSRFIEYRRRGKQEFSVIDTLLMAQSLVPDVKNYKLGTLAKFFGISLTDAHRAVNDAQATAELFLILLEEASRQGLENPRDFNKLSHKKPEKMFPRHITIYAKNKVGLYNLYKLISQSHMETFYRSARILKSNLLKYREGLILGTACRNGELTDAYLRGASFEKLLAIADEYDFIEVQPPVRYRKLFKDNLLNSEEQIYVLIKTLIKIGDTLGLPVLATGDVHYMEPEDEIFHDILAFSQASFKKTGEEKAYFYTTKEMLDAFSFLGPDLAQKIVIENPKKLADTFEKIEPIPSGKFPPKIKNADIELRKQAEDNAKSIYGDPLPEIVNSRLEKELDSIIGNGYAVMYRISQDLVKKSNEDGYYVGSRGSVGSSFVATMLGITEVNPLAPHYVCPECKYSSFITDGSFGSGVDLPIKTCPNCGIEMNRDGHQIPFEVFLGFYGDKEPDIDLNFAGEYQSTAHKFIEDTFGSDYVFRAGTIGTLAEKTAYGYVKKYCETKEIVKNPIEINRLAQGLVGVKRTSGQHPGGIMIVPKANNIHEFTPIQYPADDKKKNVITTHFDYHSISENILKLDILGHDAPSILKMLEDFTGVMMEEVDITDKKVMSLFLSPDALNADKDIFDCSSGTLGIPEFGTSFVMKMLKETKPKSFSELVNISGLSHGTDVWTDNAQNLVNTKKASLAEVICTREDIMNYLIQAGAENKMAFDVMESVRKGKGLPDKYLEELNSLDLPSWYLDSCRKIKYMFPRAHAVAYVMTSVRIAWYKVYYPTAFYASYFTTKLSDFNGQIMVQGLNAIINRMEDLKRKEDPTKKEKDEINILQVALEMHSRGYKFKKANLQMSHHSKFLIHNDEILLPLQALAGVGETVAKSIVEEGKKGDFLSIEDLIKRTGATKTVIEALDEHGALSGMAKSNQLSLLDMLAN